MHAADSFLLQRSPRNMDLAHLSCCCAARHLLATADKAKLAATAGAVHSGGLQSIDDAIGSPVKPAHDAVTSFSGLPASADISTQKSQVNGAGAIHSSAQDMLPAQDRADSIVGANNGVVWVPAKGLSVPETQEGAADGWRSREWWEQSEAARRTYDPVNCHTCCMYEPESANEASASAVAAQKHTSGAGDCVVWDSNNSVMRTW